MNQTIQQAFQTFDRAAVAEKTRKGQEARLELVERFPRAGWPTMPLERYALGLTAGTESYCRWMEFKSSALGSISGGNSTKHVVYKHRDKDGWYFPSVFSNEAEAWQALRAGVVTMLERAEQGRWDEMNELMPFQYGAALWLKTLYVYFPTELLPVYSTQHLARFRYRLSGVSQKTSKKLGPVPLNRTVLRELKETPELSGLSNEEIGQFLYHWDDPRASASIYKIAPGEDAKRWPECLAGGYVDIGWPAVGDLRAFENFAEFFERFKAAYVPQYGDTPAGKATVTRKAKEVWALSKMEPGDLILANQGMSRLVAVGEVQDPPYEWAGDGNEHPHRIRVSWDTSQARSIPQQTKWAFSTVAPISIELYEQLMAVGPDSGGSVTIKPSRPLPVDKQLVELGERLEERKQVILYGPPGTGKTFTARRFLLHWLLTREEQPAAEILADSTKATSAWSRLTTAGSSGVARVTVVTFHPSYGYEDFVEGFRPVETHDSGLRLALTDGIFKRVCREASSHPDQAFVVFIDEINRGNLPRIFGELVTVLEADKRGTAVVLAQSRQPFVVPDNVYIVGTMNTADRSIKMLDAAIRRRFAFHELMPDSSLLAGKRFGDLAVDDLLDHLNDRISARVGREKQIGHSFFLLDDEPISEVEEFAKRFRYEVIPLLQEYCYEDYRALAEFLGHEVVDTESQTVRVETVEQPDALVAALAKVVNRPKSG